jgi:hypothetical protein
MRLTFKLFDGRRRVSLAVIDRIPAERLGLLIRMASVLSGVAYPAMAA